MLESTSVTRRVQDRTDFTQLIVTLSFICFNFNFSSNEMENSVYVIFNVFILYASHYSASSMWIVD